MRYTPDTGSISDVPGKEAIVIMDSDDDVEVAEKAEVVSISDDEGSGLEERGRKRLKLDMGVEGTSVSIRGEGFGERNGRGDEYSGMIGAELEDHAETVIHKYGDRDESNEDDNSDTSSNDSSEEDIKDNDEDVRREIENQLLSMDTEGRAKEMVRESLEEPVHEKASRASKKLSKKLGKKLGKMLGKKKRLTMLEMSTKLENPELRPAKRRFLIKQQEKQEKMIEKK